MLYSGPALDQRERRAPPPAGASDAWALSRVRLLEAVPEAELMAPVRDAKARRPARRRPHLLDEADERVWIVLEGGSSCAASGERPGENLESLAELADEASR